MDKTSNFRTVVRENRKSYEFEVLKMLLEPKEAARLIREKRGGMGLRECARLVGTSACTLSRIEREFNFDIRTMKLIFEWLTK